MMRVRYLLFICLLTLTFALAAQPVPQAAFSMEARQLPALYKSGNGFVQKIRLTVAYAGKPATATLRWNNQIRKEKLQNGENHFLLEMQPVSRSGQVEAVLSCGKEQASVPVTVHPVRPWKVNFIQHTHTDIGYTRSQMEVLAEQLRYIDYALDYCDATDNYPDDAKFRWVCETAWAVSEYLKNRPAGQIARLKQRVEEGRIELGAMYLNFDELPDEQTLAASLYPLKQFREAGLKSEIAMQNDVNGIGWCFTEYFQDLGINYVTMGTHGHRALICFDKPTVFWWQSPSGKKILTFRAEHYHLGNFFGIHGNDFALFEQRVLAYLDEMDAKDYPYNILAVQHSGYHTDNSPPSTQSCELIRQWNDKYEWPKLSTSVSAEFMKEVETKYAGKIETIRGAWPDWWTDGFGSGAREAAVSRITHSDVIATQAGLSFAAMLGARLPGDMDDRIAGINKALLFYDEHTFGYSESVRDPYGKDTWEQRSLKQSYAWEAFRYSGMAGEAAMGQLQTYIPKIETASIAVFNPLNWSYSGIAKAYIDHQIIPRDRHFEIMDTKGNIIPAQAGASRSDGTYWSFFVEDIPALGYAQYYIRVKDEPRQITATSAELATGADNKWYTVHFDMRKGTISRLFDKELNRQLVDPDAEWQLGEFIYEIIDSRRPMEQYRKPQFLRRPPEKIRFDTYEKGAIWDTYRFRGETVAGRDAGNLTVEYRIFNVSKKIEIVYSLRKKAVTDPEAVYIAFPFKVAGGKIHLDVPGGTIEAGADQIPGSSNDWYTVQNFATARNNEMQVVMGSREIPLMQLGGINTGRYTAGAVPQSTHMYSWPMNNYWVTNFNADQMGEMQWSYFINSGKDNSIAYATRFAWENRIPLLTRVLPPGKKKEPPLQPASLLTIEGQNLLLVNMKPVAGEHAAVLQMRETGGKKTKLNIHSDKIAIRNITVCNVFGDPLPEEQLPEFEPWENKFIKVTWQ
ncbi:MAG: glycosyl hydrolase family 38 [Tannerella sp.]|jgi:hypothetical protein|nr:glycosyl hydrolase family 38 [Tannerella sp.]